MLKVYSKELTKKDTVALAEEILRTITCESKTRRSAPSLVVLVSESIRFIVNHFKVNDHLVPLVVAFLKKDRLVIGFCLSNMNDPFYKYADFIENWGNIPSFLQEFRHFTYLYPGLDRQLDQCLYALTDHVYAESFNQKHPKRELGLKRRKVKDSINSSTVTQFQKGEEK